MTTKKAQAKEAKELKEAAEALPNYQELSTKLDELLAALQHPDCDVDEAAALYEAALKTIAQLETHLKTAKNRITKVQATSNNDSNDSANQTGR